MGSEGFTIDGRSIGGGAPIFIIAEIGTAHGGDIDRARNLVDVALEAGADCVKTQAVFADEIVHPLSGGVDLPGGNTPLYEVFRRLERDIEFYDHIKKHVESRGGTFLCTPFGLKSAAMLREMGVTAVKIASPEINHFPLLSAVAEWEVPVLLSTGVSLLKDIEKALTFLGQRVALLHCVTAYPAPETEYNINVIPHLASRFETPAGLSDHSTDPALVPALAALTSAAVIEKHFTLDKKGGGLDDPVALTPTEFQEMCKTVRTVERLPREEAWAYLSRRYDKARIQKVLGTGQKSLAPAEEENYRTTNRSILAVRSIQEGCMIDRQDVALLRSEKNLLPGLAPEYLSDVIGAKATRHIPNGKGIERKDISVDQPVE